VHSVNAALRHIGRPELPDDVIASYVGDGAPILIQRRVGGESVDEATVRGGCSFFCLITANTSSITPRFMTAFTNRLSATSEFAFIQTSTAIRVKNRAPFRRQMAVLTNKPVVPSRAIVEALGLGPFFTQIYWGKIVLATKKPDPRARANCSRKMPVSPEEAVIVGDSHVDVETGRNATACGP